MKIGLNLHNINLHQIRKSIFAKHTHQANPVLSKLSFDVFQKTTAPDFSAIEKPIEIPKYLVECYNEAFDEVMEQNPIVKEMNYKKPELIYDKEKDDAIASYNATSNTIEASSYANDDLYIVYSKDGEGFEKISTILNDKEEAKKSAENFRKTSSDVRVVKLNEAEKKAVIKSYFAHELRHSIQANLILSTEGCKEEFENFCFNDTNGIQKDIDTLISGYKELYLLTKDDKKCNISNLLRQKAGAEYMKNYVPKKIFDSNTKLKYSLVKEDTRELSVKEHFLKSYVNGKKSDNYVYDADPLELDAYHYQYEYLLTQKNPNLRAEVISAISIGNLSELYDKEEAMLKAGYPPIYGKKAN